MAIYKGSRYTSTPTYYPDGSDKKIFDIRQRFQFNTTGATYHTWTSGDTLDFLAYKIYNNSELWWAILDANPQYQSELDIKVGDIVTIPTFKEVVSKL